MLAKGCLVPSEEGGWKGGHGAGTREHSTPVWGSSPRAANPDDRTCPCAPGEPRGNPTGMGLEGTSGVPTSACRPPSRAGMTPGGALRVPPSYLVPGSGCSAPLHQGGGGGSPGSGGWGALLSSAPGTAAARKRHLGGHLTR